MRCLNQFRKSIRNRYAFCAGLSVICALLVLRTRFCLALTWGCSMQPTLRTGDLMIVDRAAYRNDRPMRGDLVIVSHRHQVLVKRVVGLPGEELEVRHGVVYVNGVNVQDDADAIDEASALHIGKGVLLDGKFAVLGDNRSLPVEQVVFAIVTREELIGRVVVTIKFREMLSFLRL